MRAVVVLLPVHELARMILHLALHARMRLLEMRETRMVLQELRIIRATRMLFEFLLDVRMLVHVLVHVAFFALPVLRIAPSRLRMLVFLLVPEAPFLTAHELRRVLLQLTLHLGMLAVEFLECGMFLNVFGVVDQAGILLQVAPYLRMTLEEIVKCSFSSQRFGQGLLRERGRHERQRHQHRGCCEKSALHWVVLPVFAHVRHGRRATRMPSTKAESCGKKLRCARLGDGCDALSGASRLIWNETAMACAPGQPRADCWSFPMSPVSTGIRLSRSFPMKSRDGKCGPGSLHLKSEWTRGSSESLRKPNRRDGWSRSSRISRSIRWNTTPVRKRRSGFTSPAATSCRYGVNRSTSAACATPIVPHRRGLTSRNLKRPSRSSRMNSTCPSPVYS